MLVIDLNTMPYRPAWEAQERAHAEVADGGEERVLLVEHAPVITFGRRPNVARHLIASDEQLASMGVEVVQSDRGGDITFHGPGQLVAYPILRLNNHGLSVGGYVRRLLEVVVSTIADFGIEGRIDRSAIGVWTPLQSPTAEEKLGKICALGVRIRRGISLHGIALNVTTDLRYFSLIVPCGLTRPVTSMQHILGQHTPDMPTVKQSLVKHLSAAFASSTSGADGGLPSAPPASSC